MSAQPITTTSQSNLLVETTDLLHLLDIIKNQVKTELNCHAPGTIQSFDPVSMTCTVTLNYQKIWRKANAVSAAPNSYTDVITPYPLLVRVPLIVLGGANGQATFPIAPKDPCLVLFCDRDIDGWLESSQLTNPPASGRLHDLSDGIALVGLNPVQNGVTYYTDGIYLRAAYAQASNNFEVGSGATGSFVSGDGKSVTVIGGIIISIL